MIVDAHVSVDVARYPIERAMETLEGAKVRSAVIFADAHGVDPVAQNRYVLESARQYGLHPFYYLGGNPFTDTRPDTLDVPDNLDEYAGICWHRWVGEGIDRTGDLDQDELDWAINLMESPEFGALTAAATHYGMPILFEESFAVTLEFIDRFPGLDIIIPHLGARSGGEARVLRTLWDNPNVYFDTSLARLDEATLSRVGPSRLLYGSAYPYGDPIVELDKIDDLPVPETIKEGIYGDNLLALLSSARAG
ncbi:MAG TPA: amidohydrolase family protein [Chloroflexota bacterium]|nr:amidohydrolase family protein [Chloroflexota bacterium]